LQVLVALPGYTAWIPSSDGELIQGAIRGGTSEYQGEPLFIGRYKLGDDLINGKVHPSHECCYIGVAGKELASKQYEILVELSEDSTKAQKKVQGSSSMPAYYS
jgi:hypothetical protein